MKNIVCRLSMMMVALLSSLEISAYDFDVDGLYYDIVSATDLTCSLVSGDNKYSGDIDVPETVDYQGRTLTVTKVGPGAFSKCYQLKSIKLPQTISAIGHGAFSNCSDLISFEIPSTVSMTKIENSTFNGCSSLREICIPDNVSTIGEYAFTDCFSLSIVKFSHRMAVSDNAFFNCYSLSEFPFDHTYEIGENAFANCSSITSICFGSSIDLDGYGFYQGIKISFSAFDGCENLAELSIIANANISYTTEYSGNVVKHPFPNCPNLKTVNILPPVGKFETELEKYDMVESCYQPWLSKLPLSRISVNSPCISTTKERYQKYNSYRLSLPSVEVVEFKELVIDGCYDCKPSTVNTFCEQWFYMYGFNNLKKIICSSENPPINFGFSDKQLFNIELYVPDNYMSIYEESTPWMNFWNIKPITEYSGIKIVQNDMRNQTSIISRFDINGNSVNDLYHGIIIIVYSDGSTKKIVQ